MPSSLDLDDEGTSRESETSSNRPKRAKYSWNKIGLYLQLIKALFFFLGLNASFFRDRIEKWTFIICFIVLYCIHLYFVYCLSLSDPSHSNFRLLRLNKKHN
jgi:NhaP-type Na+/H+ or K+/H+ antiporter